MDSVPENKNKIDGWIFPCFFCRTIGGSSVPFCGNILYVCKSCKYMSVSVDGDICMNKTVYHSTENRVSRNNVIHSNKKRKRKRKIKINLKINIYI